MPPRRSLKPTFAASPLNGGLDSRTLTRFFTTTIEYRGWKSYVQSHAGVACCRKSAIKCDPFFFRARCFPSISGIVITSFRNEIIELLLPRWRI